MAKFLSSFGAFFFDFFSPSLCCLTSKDFFFSFEFSSLGDLSSNLLQGKSQNEVDLMDILHDVTQGLRHLHSKNYIHCDIKPANIIKFPSPGSSRPVYKISLFLFSLAIFHFPPFTRSIFYFFSSLVLTLDLKTGDLGLALRCGDGGVIQSSEGDGDGKYVAPEVLGQRLVSQKADVYSLGMSIIELVFLFFFFHFFALFPCLVLYRGVLVLTEPWFQGRGEIFPSRRGEEWQKLKQSFQIGQFGFMASSGFISVVKVTFISLSFLHFPKQTKPLQKMIETDLDKRPTSERLSQQLKIFLPSHSKPKAKIQKMVKGVSCPNGIGENSVLKATSMKKGL